MCRTANRIVYVHKPHYSLFGPCKTAKVSLLLLLVLVYFDSKAGDGLDEVVIGGVAVGTLVLL